METDTERRLKGQLGKFRDIARDKLGDGIWGLEMKDKFTHEEIVFLFARIFQYLGFDHIRQVRTDYPDCIGVEKGKEVGIEFEPVLSSFKDHIRKDDLNLCQYIVCWKDDLSPNDLIREEIKNIKIIKLEEEYKEIGPKGLPKGHLEIGDTTLKLNQLKILKAFIDLGRDVLTTQDIAEATGIHGKPLGGAISAFKQLQKGTNDWILRRRPENKYEINPGYKSEIIRILIKWGIK